MDGLECKELLFSTVKKANKSVRFDPEYYSKLALSTESFILSKPHYFLDTRNVVSGPFGSTLKSSSYLEKGDVPFVRIENIKGGFYISRSNLVYISSFDNSRIANSQLSEDDIVLSKVGNSIGFFARVDSVLKGCNISENNIGIKLEGFSTAQKHAILTYFNSKYGQILLLRRRSGNAQPKLNVDDVCFIPIPVFGNSFCEKISNIIIQSEILMHQAQDIYEEANRYLLLKLNYDAQKISADSIAVKTITNTFGNTGRLDAEYYQPKFDDLFLILSQLTTKSLDSIVTTTKSIEPGSECYGEIGIPFIRVSDVSITGISNPTIKIPENTVSSIETLFPKKDTILFSKDGSVGIAYQVEEDLRVVTSGALLHFKVKNTKEILPEYLTLVLNSDIVQLQAERDASGAIIQHWKPSDIKKVTIPILSHEHQKEIADSVKSSFTKRRKAEKLIQVAINAVELAIENGEDAALKWLETQVD